MQLIQDGFPLAVIVLVIQTAVQFCFNRENVSTYDVTTISHDQLLVVLLHPEWSVVNVDVLLVHQNIVVLDFQILGRQLVVRFIKFVIQRNVDVRFVPVHDFQKCNLGR